MSKFGNAQDRALELVGEIDGRNIEAFLLPGGPVTWEPMDDRHARARVSAGGLQATLVATFGADGLLQSFHAEEDGDLNTPYHGSGEHVQRSDYQPHNGMLIPMRFTISRKAGGQIQPFWRGSVTQIRFL